MFARRGVEDRYGAISMGVLLFSFFLNSLGSAF